ncbi:MAG: amidohydrolase [Opitutus sp.]|nr:amidohydrolase [Opitutus sp.]
MVIDSHVHLYPTELNADPAGWASAHGEPHWATLATRQRKNGRPVQSFPDVAGLLGEMDAAGVNRAVLLGWYWEKPETCVWQNRFYAACVRAHPDRLSAFATLHPAGGREATLEEVRRAQGEGLIGLGELSPHSQGFAIDDPAFRAALTLAGELRVPVNLHVTDPDSRPFPGRVETPGADFVTLARAFPATTFILAHWGGMLPAREPALKGLANVCYDTAASPLLYDASVWSWATALVGTERVLFGSDFPLNLYPKLDERPVMARLVEEARKAGMSDGVMGRNAMRVLRL